MANPTTDDLSKWYSYRACEIERLSRQVDLSVELVKLATERGVEVSVKSIERLSRQVDLSVELVKLATERGVEVSVKSIVNPAHATTSIRGHYFKALVITSSK